MGNRYERKQRSRVQGPRSKVEPPRMVACGKINKHGSHTRISVEFMVKLSQNAAQRVFGDNTARAEEIANA